MDTDIVRVIHDLKTFTTIDLAKALDWPEGTAGARLSDWCKTGHVMRVKIGRTFLYAIGPKAARIYAKLPPVDPDERCLPLSFENVSPEPGIAGGCCPDWNSADMRLIELEPGGMIQAWQCPHCDHRFPVAVYNQH